MSDISHWNYRVIRYRDGSHSINEVSYKKDGKTVNGIDATPNAVLGNDPWECRVQLDWMKMALEKPPIDFDTFQEIKEPQS